MYDFIVFEHSMLRNHLVDLLAVARMLQDSGYSVAIADLGYNSEMFNDSGFPLVKMNQSIKSFKNPNNYLRTVIDELSPQAKNFYVGSMLSDTSLNWLKFFPSEKCVFIWGLRSFFFTYYQRIKFSRFYPQKFLQSIRNLNIIHKHKNIRLFVSDEIICDEFIELGIEPWRLVIRKERFCTEYKPVKSKRSGSLKLLAIGALRPEKRIDLCIDALESITPTLDIDFIIAGKAYSIHDYDKMLLRRASQNKSIQRIDKRLSEEEYDRLINECDFLLLCDEKQPSSVTNGTMAEALLAGRPIIAPNYNPYKYIVEKYGVGLLYDLYEKDSIITAFKSALNSVPTEFSNGLRSFQQDNMYDSILYKFKTDLQVSLALTN